MFAVLFSPGEVFSRVAAAPNILAPLVTLVVVALIANAVFVSRVDFEQVIAEQLENDPNMQKLPEKDREKAMETAISMGAKVAPVAAILGTLFGAPLIYLAAATLFWVIFKVAGSGWGFKAAFSTTIHSFAPGMVGAVVMALVVLIGDPSQLDINDPIKSHLGALVSQESVGPLVYGLLSSVEVFSIWVAALLFVGFRRVAGAKPAVAGAVVGLGWLLLALFKVGMVMLRASAGA